MDNIDKLVSEALADFQKVAALANTKFTADSITVDIARKPHTSPRKLPDGNMAVYAFFLDGQALKVGKVGPNSNARYTSQHYNPNSAHSNLARSILANPAKIEAVGVNEPNVGEWIRQHTDRINLLVPDSLGDPMLSLLESFLHVRWEPVFEGRNGAD
jgi:hypothetical protein